MGNKLGTGGTLPISALSREFIRRRKKDKICHDEEKQDQSQEKQKDMEDEDAVDVLVEDYYGTENINTTRVYDEVEPEGKRTNSEKNQESRKIDIVI